MSTSKQAYIYSRYRIVGSSLQVGFRRTDDDEWFEYHFDLQGWREWVAEIEADIAKAKN